LPAASSLLVCEGVFVRWSMSVTAAAPRRAAGRGAAGPTQGPGPFGLWAVVLGLMFVSALIHVRGASPRTGAWAPLAAALMGVVFLAGCGGQSASPPPPSGTPPGKYTLTVTATSGGLSPSTTVMLFVS